MTSEVISSTAQNVAENVAESATQVVALDWDTMLFIMGMVAIVLVLITATSLTLAWGLDDIEAKISKPSKREEFLEKKLNLDSDMLSSIHDMLRTAQRRKDDYIDV